ncbi:hypothetical protein E4U41_006041 [Claviceps citrina]|nr:hypothetical protein E4U41_006041 [Claviceps citrina]
MMCYQSLDEHNLPAAWKAWAESHPTFATLLRRSVAELVLPDKRRFRPLLPEDITKQSRKTIQIENPDYIGGIAIMQDGKQAAKTEKPKGRVKLNTAQTDQPDDTEETDSVDYDNPDELDNEDNNDDRNMNKSRQNKRAKLSYAKLLVQSPKEQVTVKKENDEDNNNHRPGFEEWAAKAATSNFFYRNEYGQFIETEYPLPTTEVFDCEPDDRSKYSWIYRH